MDDPVDSDLRDIFSNKIDGYDLGCAILFAAQKAIDLMKSTALASLENTGPYTELPEKAKVMAAELTIITIMNQLELSTEKMKALDGFSRMKTSMEFTEKVRDFSKLMELLSKTKTAKIAEMVIGRTKEETIAFLQAKLKAIKTETFPNLTPITWESMGIANPLED
jgi:hypothetical protein